ncbi:MAG: hypothetical protein E6K71_09875 [Candidatus Eisenbacteria bacterium]|uniref:dUTP diphosphatase n=1 Tax=Eiseniibacteriota bacterium TaxID=2212470 RepID=A0A538S7X7_UNCEI|nr:MAG: hypothetical protein E6K71_09875 [Candidatus Eisenbacteria bacterium]
MSERSPLAESRGSALAQAPGPAPVPVRYSLDPHAFAPPAYQTEHAAGLDVYAAVTDPLTIPPGTVNFGTEPYVVHRGDRVAQLVFAQVARVSLAAAADLSETARGDGGFGHSGR